MSWIYLLIAGALEIAWTIALKCSAGFTRPLPIMAVVVGSTLSFLFLALSLRQIPLGTAYAVWTGIGVLGAACAGVLLFGEGLGGPRLFFLALIVIGILGMKLSSAS